MTVFEKIVYGIYVVGWIAAPFIVKDILASRNIFLPSDIATGGVAIWYAIPLLQFAWMDRRNPKKKSGSNGPSYTDRGQNDWRMRD